MLNIICLNADNYLGRGAEYVNILANMIGRNISDKTPYKFICFTNTPEGIEPAVDIRPLPVQGIKGWWNKLALFKEGLFPDGDRILYIDLDTVITSGMDDIIKYNGEFAILRDFYRQNGLQSSIMAWSANTHYHLWDKWESSGEPDLHGGDQQWIELQINNPDIWQDLFPESFASYKVHSTREIPKNARFIVFHGEPRPHEITDGWMPYIWKIGGGTVMELTHVCNTEDSIITENIKHALTLEAKWLELAEPNEGHAVIIGGGPSLKDEIEEIRKRQVHGQFIISTNNTCKFLLENGITPDCHVMLDAREENKEFVPELPIACYYASQCHPEVLASSKDLILWHPFIDGILAIIGDNTGDPLLGGGSTVGLKSIALAHTLGYRKFHLYGFDSSYRKGDNHAYKQPLNDGENVIDVEMNGTRYRAAPWMCAQVESFKDIAKALVEEGCILTVHGDGLLPDVARIMSTPDVRDTEIVMIDGVWWPSRCRESRLYTEFTIGDIRLLLSKCPNKQVAIQAGGNVGIWPREFSKEFEEVYTFEPDALNFECLVRNTEGRDNIKAWNAALGDKPGTADLHRLSYNCGAHRIKEGNEFHVMTIDALDLPACDLIQLDIEGYELTALKGAQKTIEAFRPVIMIEDKGLSEQYGSKKGDVALWLESFGYVLNGATARDVIFVQKENVNYIKQQQESVCL